MDTGITKDENGAYRWTGIVDKGYEQKAFSIALYVSGGICAVFILMGLILGGGMLGVFLLTSLAVMAVVGGACWLMNRFAGKRRQRYIMTDEFVGFRQRRYYAPFTYKSIKKAVVCPSRNMIELYQRAGSGAVFVPSENFEFVKDYILLHLPEKAEVVYE